METKRSPEKAAGKIMPEKPTYEDLEKRIQELENAEYMREQTEVALQRRLEFEQLVKEISSEFAGVGGGSSIDSAIDRALSSVGAFTGADRAYIFSFKDVTTRADNTHEWCAEGVDPQINNLKDIPIGEEMPWFTNHMRNHRVFHVPDVAALPHEARREQTHFEAQQIQSLIVVPMETGEHLIGFLGFDAVTKRRTWSEDDKAILQFFAQTLSQLIERKLVEEALRENEKKFSTLFQASPVYIAFTTIDDGCFLEVNDAFTRITGFKRNEVLGRTPVEIGLWFDPEERAKFIELAQKKGGFSEEEVRFQRKNGDFLFGIWSAEKIELDGKTCLISVLVDITERKKTQAALLQERDKLREAISKIKTLSGLVPICSNCKKIRDDQGYWNQIEKYISERSNAEFSHGICPECVRKLYPELGLYPKS